LTRGRRLDVIATTVSVTTELSENVNE
jgi:hypothetical protein